ncbi:MAG: hypothetical protein LAO77_03930 [Acidobacteriia bacterium]|nr:hypothetical protein [Terriglobia bacterium]
MPRYRTGRRTLLSYRHIVTMLAVACGLVTTVIAFKPTAEFGHVGIVTDAVTPITRTSSSGETMKFSARAIRQIRDATAGVDEIFSSRGEFSVPQAHCDDELLPDCSRRIIDIKNAVINLIKDEATRNGEEARAQLGRALHTLQDFYAHSNWVNNPGPNNGTFNGALGVSVLTRLSPTEPTCIDDFFDGTLTGRGLTDITTGYFGGVEPPANKCAHGVLPGAGIHKDEPGRPFFVPARARAVDGTRDFVNQILNAPGVAGNDDAIRALMDIRGTLGFVIDDTGSMGSSIDGVKTAVGQIVTSVQDPKKRPDNYLLETFNDPTIGTPFVTTDAGALLGAVNAIFVNGGGDCPELSQSGLLAAIAAARSGSKLYFFSDASAKDASLAGNVTAAANAKKIIINYVLTGSCSPVDPAYISGAQNTGGQLFFIGRNETGKIFGLIEPSLTGDLQPMMLLNTTLGSGSTSVTVPVDSTLTSVTFSVSLDLLSAVHVIRPSGAEVLPTDPDATITVLSTGRIVTVRTPSPGDWQLQIAGAGDLSASVMGNSALELADFNFVERRGRPEHEGLFPINGQPVLGTTQIGRATMSGDFSNAQFELVSPAGATLQAITLTAGTDPDAAADEFVGNVDLPAAPFRVSVRGTDANGFAFVRTFPPTLRAQSVRVRAVAQGVRLTPGATTPVQFEVTNLGSPVSFLVSAVDDAHLVSGVGPLTLTLGPNESATTTVSLTVPAGTTLLFDTLTVVARSAADAAINNSTRVGLAIGVSDRDGDGIDDDHDACPDSDRAATIVVDGCDSGVANTLSSNGCTSSDQIAGIAAGAGNHGDFVSGVALLTNSWVSDGIISGSQKGAIQSCAAKSKLP